MVVSKICQTHYAYIDLELNGGEYKTDPDRQVWSFYFKKKPSYEGWRFEYTKFRMAFIDIKSKSNYIQLIFDLGT